MVVKGAPGAPAEETMMGSMRGRTTWAVASGALVVITVAGCGRGPDAGGGVQREVRVSSRTPTTSGSVCVTAGENTACAGDGGAIARAGDSTASVG